MVVVPLEPLRLRGIRAGYGTRVVLDGVNLAFPRDRVTAIVGPGGSGKSTLLRAAVGVAEGGALWVTGSSNLGDAFLLPQARRGIDGHSRPDLGTTRARLAEQLTLHGIDLRQPQLAPLAAASVPMAGLTRALESGRRTLLLDEIDAHGDPPAVASLAFVLRRLARRGHDVVLVTHNLALVRRAADHVVVLLDGVVLDAGSLHQVERAPASQRVRDFFRLGG